MIRKQAIVYWDRIDNDSYIKRIEDFKGIKKLDFNKPITFWSKKMAVKNAMTCKKLK